MSGYALWSSNECVCVCVMKYVIFPFKPVVPDEILPTRNIPIGFYDLADEIYVPTEVSHSIDGWSGSQTNNTFIIGTAHEAKQCRQ